MRKSLNLLLAILLSFTSCNSTDEELNISSNISFAQQQAIFNLFVEAKNVHNNLSDVIAPSNGVRRIIKKTSEYTETDYNLLLENSERLGVAGVELFKLVGFSDSEIKKIQGDNSIAVFGLAAIEVVSDLDINDLNRFGGISGNQVVSKEFIRDGIRCLIEALDLDGIQIIFGAVEVSVLTKEQFKKAVEKVIKKVLTRSSALAVSGAVGAAIIIGEWVWCMRDHWT